MHVAVAVADTEDKYALMDHGTFEWYKCNDRCDKHAPEETYDSCNCGWLFVSCSSKSVTHVLKFDQELTFGA